MAEKFQLANPTRIKISDFGKRMEESAAASQQIIDVINDINTKIGSTEDEGQKVLLEQWSNKLTDAVLTTVTSASTTTSEVFTATSLSKDVSRGSGDE